MEQGRDSTGARLHHDSWDMKQRAWWATSPDELKTFVGAMVYMVRYQEGETEGYWYRDLFTGPNYATSLRIRQDRFAQLLKFLHCGSDFTQHPEPTTQQIDKMMSEEYASWIRRGGGRSTQ